jgi:PIN domain nuclease of toxin-antitoxin system
VNVLLDSHALLWALHDPDELRPEAAKEIRDPAHVVFFSAASVWELELKATAGKLVLPEDWLAVTDESGFLELPVRGREARRSARLQWEHRDPFDRMLVAQALEHGLRIATRDTAILQQGVSVLRV